MVLDFLREKHPSDYAAVQYTIVEISSLLAEKQRARLSKAGHGKVSNVVVADACSLHECGGSAVSSLQTTDPCFVIALEVLDNLPHDKVVWAPYEGLNGPDGVKWGWHEVVIKPRSAIEVTADSPGAYPGSPGWDSVDAAEAGAGGWEECLRPLSDPDIKKALSMSEVG